MKCLYFDESGFTGTNLMDKDQPIFCYLGLECSPDIETAFLELKAKYRYGDSEVKGTNIIKHTHGQNLLKELWSLCAGKVKYVLADKKYALAAKIFEYVYEPVFAEHNTILYNSGLHIFFANFLYWEYLTQSNKSAELIFEKFHDFIKSHKESDFVESIGSVSYLNDPLIYFYQFCNLYKEQIASDITFDDPADIWILDITNTALFSLLSAFEGDGSDPLKVTCDNSKPICAYKNFLDVQIGNEQPLYIEFQGVKRRINFNLASEIQMEDSKNCVALQIADFLVSSVIYAYTNNDEFTKEIKPFLNNSIEISISSRLPSDYSYSEICGYLTMLDLLSRKELNYYEKLYAVQRISYDIRLCHKLDLLKYLSLNNEGLD